MDRYKRSCLLLFILWWKALLILKRHLVPLSDPDTGNSVLCVQILLSPVCHFLQTLAICDMKFCALIDIGRP